MPDLDDAVPLEGTPDLSDLTMVIINAETREGRQLSFMLMPDEHEKMAMVYTSLERDPVEVHTGDRVEPVATYSGIQLHQFAVKIEDVD